MAAPHVNCYLAPTQERRSWAYSKYRFSSLRHGLTKVSMKGTQSTSFGVAHVQPTSPVDRFIGYFQ